MSLLEQLPHLCTAKRRTRTLDSLGGSKDAYTTLFADRACWKQPLGETETIDFMRRSINVTNKFYFADDPELDERDIIVHDGDTYEVRSIGDPDCSAGLGVLWKAVVEKMATGAVL
jgi:hypothetical protein